MFDSTVSRRCLPGVVDNLGDETGPAALVGSSETTTGIAVEELVEPEVVLPVLVEVKQVGLCVDGAAALVVAGEEVLHSVLKLLGDLAQMHVVA